MAQVRSFTLERQLRIENETVIDGFINDAGNLILTRRDGFTIDAGRVTGVKGDPGSGVRDVEVTYQGSSSGTVEPTGEWTTNVPPVPSGYFLWVRTVTTYADPDDPETTFQTKTFTVVRQPEPGQPGEDGRGIFQIATEYQSGASGVEPPTSNWLPSIPTVTPGRFLWTRTTTVYTDGTSSVAYSVAKQGEDGQPGEPGESNYLHVAYADNETGTLNFSTTDPSGRSYLGVYSDTNPNDSTDPSKYAWSLIKGASGVGVTSTVVRYQAGTSGTVVPQGTWLEIIPAVEDNQFLWTRTVMNFTDGASTTTYSVAKQGSKGLDGTPGISVSSVTPFYYLSASTPSKPTTLSPPSPWSILPTTYTVGETRNLYSTIRTIFSNNTFLYSNVVLDTAYSSAKAVHEASVSRDTSLEEQALKAQTSADGKNKVYVQGIAPVANPNTPFGAGDMWYETIVVDVVVDGVVQQRTSIKSINIWDGSKWAPYNLVANSLLVPGSITADMVAANIFNGKEINGASINGSFFSVLGYSTDPVWSLLDNCEAIGNWTGSNGALSLDTTSPAQGLRSIRVTRNISNQPFSVQRPLDLGGRNLDLSGTIRIWSPVNITVSVVFSNTNAQSQMDVEVTANTWVTVPLSTGQNSYQDRPWTTFAIRSNSTNATYFKIDELSLQTAVVDDRRLSITRDATGNPVIKATFQGKETYTLLGGSRDNQSSLMLRSFEDSVAWTKRYTSEVTPNYGDWTEYRVNTTTTSSTFIKAGTCTLDDGFDYSTLYMNGLVNRTSALSPFRGGGHISGRNRGTGPLALSIEGTGGGMRISNDNNLRPGNTSNYIEILPGAGGNLVLGYNNNPGGFVISNLPLRLNSGFDGDIKQARIDSTAIGSMALGWTHTTATPYDGMQAAVKAGFVFVGGAMSRSTAHNASDVVLRLNVGYRPAAPIVQYAYLTGAGGGASFIVVQPNGDVIIAHARTGSGNLMFGFSFPL